MSVLMAPRMPAAHGDRERASVVLPTVKCSSCAVAIPLNSLGEHVCVPLPELKEPPPISHSSGRDSPTNPFFPSPPLRPTESSASIRRPNAPKTLRPPDHSRFEIGNLVAPPRGYPADVPTSAVSANSVSKWPQHDRGPPSPAVAAHPVMPDTTSGGNAGMAGVGRRAFAAAAWSVRAGVALAATTGRGFTHEGPQDVAPIPESTPSPPGPQSKPSRHTPSPTGNEPMARLAHSPNPGARSTPSLNPGIRSNRSPTPREPVILPKVPLASRSRNRSNTADDLSHNDRRAQSRNEDRRPPARPVLEERSISAMSSRSIERSAAERDQHPFFDRYRQMMGSQSDQTHMMSREPMESPPIGELDSPAGDLRRDSYSSSVEESLLPWVTPASPEESHGRFDHQRYPTDGSIGSTSSSSCEPSADARGNEVELVMTPSQSWEGLVDRANSVDPKVAATASMYSTYSDNAGGVFSEPTAAAQALANIGEEEEDEDEEGERFILGQPAHRSPSTIRKARPSSQSTVTMGSASPPAAAHALDRDAHHSPSKLQAPNLLRSRTMGGTDLGVPCDAQGRPKRTCAHCGDPVGGVRRFVERDGVVLCERDWKKMYLPSCRRCKLPIEKSAVSSSDGQLKGKWHRACFTCTRCDKPFADDDFYVHDGRPWCQHHYAEENGTLCAAFNCGEAIEGPCILAPGSGGSKDQRFHPGHLRCDHRGGVSGAQNCREPMTEYYDIAGERYCERHVEAAVRRAAASSSAAAGSSGIPVPTPRAQKRRTRLVDLPRTTAAP